MVVLIWCDRSLPKEFSRSTFREESDTSGSSTSSGFLASNLGGRRQEQEENVVAPQHEKNGKGSRREEEREESDEAEEGGQKADRRKQPTPVKNKSAPVPPMKQVARKSTAAVKVLCIELIFPPKFATSQMITITGRQETSSGKESTQRGYSFFEINEIFAFLLILTLDSFSRWLQGLQGSSGQDTKL